MRGGKKELWENLMVVWQDPVLDGDMRDITLAGDWYLTRVVNHHASADPSAPKYITHDELVNSALHSDMINAGSKQEALLKYAASGRAGSVWSIDAVDFRPSMDSGDITKWYRLVKEEF